MHALSRVLQEVGGAGSLELGQILGVLGDDIDLRRLLAGTRLPDDLCDALYHLLPNRTATDVLNDDLLSFLIRLSSSIQAERNSPEIEGASLKVCLDYAFN